ncbi:hydroxyacylglutathione hydrolase [Sphingomonas psychrolutea]|uniref:Hydroxyacylglutathione hydrolase n=1 Tax=Sphingomonas psychrolutea TaxID=1259676 RepID=A0ABQ1H6L2_9SPHN|nr:hydroxyacylglutathione hydrolase [Sphingomonas psychrolutea]GGA60954.1 hydroxyacylglutathione hydrolase [Sphingomonas psychrolutea]
MPSTLEIVRIPALSDNYVWLVHDSASDETIVVDPSEAAPVLAVAEARGWTISQIWNTHWHPDHTDGNAAIKALGATVSGPAAEADKIPTLDVPLREGDSVRIGDHVAQVMETPGHTAGHIVFHMAEDAALFSGDTLFAMGCGRLFEGGPAQMYANMQRLATLPPETIVYCAHEYTQSNGRYAAAAEPDNAAVTERMKDVDAKRVAGEPTVPTTIALELATNPFLRATSAEQLAERRAAKDVF